MKQFAENENLSARVAYFFKNLRFKKTYSSSKEFAMDHNLDHIIAFKAEKGFYLTARTIAQMLVAHQLTPVAFFIDLGSAGSFVNYKCMVDDLKEIAFPLDPDRMVDFYTSFINTYLKGATVVFCNREHLEIESFNTGELEPLGLIGQIDLLCVFAGIPVDEFIQILLEEIRADYLKGILFSLEMK